MTLTHLGYDRTRAELLMIPFFIASVSELFSRLFSCVDGQRSAFNMAANSGSTFLGIDHENWANIL
jgi:hypothetical protein